jgi:thiamine kinase-like enzyme
MYQPSSTKHNLQHDAASLNRLALHDVDPDSVVGSAILNYVVNHRDAHLNNFLVHEGKLVPIDFGASFDLPADEPNINRHSNVLDEDFLRWNKNKPLNKNLLEGYIKNKTPIIEEAIKVSQLYPSAIRDNVLSNLVRRLEKLEQIYNKDNPNIQDLRQLLISQPSYIPEEPPQQTNAEPTEPPVERMKQDSIKTHITTGPAKDEKRDR